MPILPHQSRAILHQFCQKHKNQPGYVIGGGPSLLPYVHQPRIRMYLESQITFGVNKSYEWFLPTYMVAGDAWWWKTFWPHIETFPCWKIGLWEMFPTVLQQRIPPFTLLLNRGSTQHILPPELCGPFSFYNNSGVAALRIAYALGCQPIYLLGIDLCSGPEGQTHWHNGYPQKGIITTEGKYRSFYATFEETLRCLSQQNYPVYSCSPVSRLNHLIPYVNLEEHIHARYSREISCGG